MEAGERTISQILTEQIRYEIPAYQRPYSWEKGNVEQLLDDVWEAYVANDEEYFIGSLITIEREKGRLYDVVDGQQRLGRLIWSIERSGYGRSPSRARPDERLMHHAKKEATDHTARSPHGRFRTKRDLECRV